jgi:hypothetical protein
LNKRGREGGEERKGEGRRRREKRGGVEGYVDLGCTMLTEMKIIDNITIIKINTRRRGFAHPQHPHPHPPPHPPPPPLPEE